MIGVTLSVFRRRRQKLRAAGFPEPVPGLASRYDPLAIEAWLARVRDPAAPSPSADAETDEQRWERILDNRAAAFAHAAGRA